MSSGSPCGLFLEIGDHVVARDNLTGHVAYMGHLDVHPSSASSSSAEDEPDSVVDPASSLHVGLVLDAPVGTHDGQLGGKRLGPICFTICSKD